MKPGLKPGDRIVILDSVSPHHCFSKGQVCTVVPDDSHALTRVAGISRFSGDSIVQHLGPTEFSEVVEDAPRDEKAIAEAQAAFDILDKQYDNFFASLKK